MNYLSSFSPKPTTVIIITVIATVSYCVIRGPIDMQEFAGNIDTRTIAEEVVIKQVDQQSVHKLRASFRDALTRITSSLDPAEKYQADIAIREAISLVGRVNIEHTPWATVTDMGIAAVQWQAGENGLLLMFAGDGVVSVSRASSTKDYSSNSHDYSIAGNAALFIEAFAEKLNS